MREPSGNGIFDEPSNHPFDQTVEKVIDIARSRGLTVFAVVDHSGEAEKVAFRRTCCRTSPESLRSRPQPRNSSLMPGTLA